jgi:hypothetical protein
MSLVTIKWGNASTRLDDDISLLCRKVCSVHVYLLLEPEKLLYLVDLVHALSMSLLEALFRHDLVPSLLILDPELDLLLLIVSLLFRGPQLRLALVLLLKQLVRSDVLAEEPCLYEVLPIRIVVNNCLIVFAFLVLSGVTQEGLLVLLQPVYEFLKGEHLGEAARVSLDADPHLI